MSKTFYYTFDLVAVDYSSQTELEKQCTKLVSFSDLDNRFALLNSAFENKQKERADITLIPYPQTEGVAELCVYHNIKFKLFSKAVKSQCFCVSISFFIGEDLLMFEKDTQNIDEVRAIFKDVVENDLAPDISQGWKRVF